MTHIYDGNDAKAMVDTILKQYIPAIVKLKEGIEEYCGDRIDEI